jgi:hypothetical protein
MKKLTIKEAFEQNNLEVIQSYIDIGFDFGTLYSDTYQYLTKESLELLNRNSIEVKEQYILSSQDKAVFDEMFKQDKNIFYTIFYKIVFNKWMDYFEWDWDIKKVFEKKMFADVIEVLLNDIEIFEKVQDKLISIDRTTYDTLKYLQKYREKEINEKYFTLAISKEKYILSEDDKDDIIINGEIEKIKDVLDEDTNPLYILINHIFTNELNVKAWDGVIESVSQKSNDIFIKYFESFQYDFDKNFKIQIYDRKAFKANGQSFWITPLIFLDKYINHNNKKNLIKKALQKSENIFNNKIFRIARTYQSYNDEILEYSGNYFEYFNSKPYQKIIFDKLNEEEFNKIKHDKSKENLIKLAIKRDDFDMSHFAKWGFEPSKDFIDFLVKTIGDEKVKQYGLIDITDLFKNKDWCIEQLLDNNKSIISKIDKKIIESVINDYSSSDGANSHIANNLLKENINHLIRKYTDDKYGYLSFHDYYLKIDKKEFFDGVINILELQKPKEIHFKSLNEVLKNCYISNPKETQDKFNTLSKPNQNKIKDIAINNGWLYNGFTKYLVSHDKKFIKKKSHILEHYVENMNIEELKTSLLAEFEFQKSNGLFYYLAILFRTNDNFDIGYEKRFEDNIKQSNYFDIKKADEIIKILFEQDFPNKKTLPKNMNGTSTSNIIPTKGDKEIDFATMLIGHLIYFRQSTLLEMFKNSFKKYWKHSMSVKDFGNRNGNFMHYIIDNNINDTKIIKLIKNDIDPKQVDRYKQTWEKFAQKQKFEI